MALKNIIGIDHAVVMVRDLDKAAENYRQLGFTLSPRGTHSAHMGTGNYTIMFDPDYMELLGVLVATEHNAPARAFVDRHGEGIERIAFTAIDSAAGAEEIRARGLTPIGPTDFERPVTLPDGTISAAKFRTFMWPTAEAPGGVRIFACQHKTRETVWIPELMKHANAAKRIRQTLIATPEPAQDAAHLGRLIDREPKDGSRRCSRRAVRRRPRRLRLSDAGAARQTLSRRAAHRPFRARWRRPGPRQRRSRSHREGAGSGCVAQRGCDLRATGQGQRHPARLRCRLI